jgi:hypothetical protein
MMEAAFSSETLKTSNRLYGVIFQKIQLFRLVDIQRRFEETFYFDLQGKRVNRGWREVRQGGGGPILCSLLANLQDAYPFMPSSGRYF